MWISLWTSRGEGLDAVCAYLDIFSKFGQSAVSPTAMSEFILYGQHQSDGVGKRESCTGILKILTESSASEIHVTH